MGRLGSFGKTWTDVWLLVLIYRVQTSYITVEPKKKKQAPGIPSTAEVPALLQQQPRQGGLKELRKARIVITVKRTDSYKQWLIENPLESGDGDDDIPHEEAGS